MGACVRFPNEHAHPDELRAGVGVFMFELDPPEVEGGVDLEQTASKFSYCFTLISRVSTV